MKKCTIVIIFVCLALPITVMAEGYRVAFSNGYITHSWRTQMTTDLIKEAAYYQGQGLISDLQMQHAGPDVNLQIQHIREFIEAKVDLLIVVPLSTTALNPILEEAVDAGVLVFLCDFVTSEKVWQVLPKYSSWMGRLARYVFERLEGKGNVVYLSGIEGAPPSDFRDEGFEEVLKEYPGINLITKEFGFWDQARAEEVMMSILAVHPHIDGVVSQDGQSFAVVSAFNAMNRPLPVMNGEASRPFLELWAENLDEGFTSYAIANGPGFAVSISLGVGIRMLQGQSLKPGLDMLEGKTFSFEQRREVTDNNVEITLEEHTKYHGIEEYIDEIWSQEELDSLFE